MITADRVATPDGPVAAAGTGARQPGRLADWSHPQAESFSQTWRKAGLDARVERADPPYLNVFFAGAKYAINPSSTRPPPFITLSKQLLDHALHGAGIHTSGGSCSRGVGRRFVSDRLSTGEARRLLCRSDGFKRLRGFGERFPAGPGDQSDGRPAQGAPTSFIRALDAPYRSAAGPRRKSPCLPWRARTIALPAREPGGGRGGRSFPPAPTRPLACRGG